MCPDCDGLGTRYSFDPDLLIPDTSLSFSEGAIPLVGRMRGMGRWRKHIFQGVANTLGIDLTTPWRDLPAAHQDLILYGAGDRHITFEWKQRGGGVWKHGGKWEGIVPQLLSSFKKAAAGPRRLQLEKYMRVVRCPTCQGQRLNAQARAVRVSGKTLVEVCAMPVGDLARWFAAPGEAEQEQGIESQAPRLLTPTPLPGRERASEETGKENRLRVCMPPCRRSSMPLPAKCSRKSVAGSVSCSTSVCIT